MDADQMVVSVRGRATQFVAPDRARLFVTVSSSDKGAPAANARVADALGVLTRALAERGGVVQTPETQRVALSWSTADLWLHEEDVWDEGRQSRRKTGTVTASVTLHLVVRAFGEVEPLQALLAALDDVTLDNILWEVDDDNPAWAEVRTAAVLAAVDRGRDYAAALGGIVTAVEQLADDGLLTSDTGGDLHVGSGRRMGGFRRERGEGTPPVPHVDPVPQRLIATVDARLLATGVGLA